MSKHYSIFSNTHARTYIIRKDYIHICSHLRSLLFINLINSGCKFRGANYKPTSECVKSPTVLALCLKFAIISTCFVNSYFESSYPQEHFHYHTTYTHHHFFFLFLTHEEEDEDETEAAAEEFVPYSM